MSWRCILLNQEKKMQKVCFLFDSSTGSASVHHFSHLPTAASLKLKLCVYDVVDNLILVWKMDSYNGPQ